MTAKYLSMALPMVLALSCLPAAAQKVVNRRLRDRAQIETLMWQYVRALDTENADAYAALYTPDGQFGSGSSAVKGRDALKKMINDLRQRGAETEANSGQKRPPMYHVLTNTYVEFITGIMRACKRTG